MVSDSISFENAKWDTKNTIIIAAAIPETKDSFHITFFGGEKRVVIGGPGHYNIRPVKFHRLAYG
jgi:hypothetical protein